MCTVVALARPGHAWPVLIAANRDERLDRAWGPPGAHWPGLPGVVGGRDRSGGGTWMAARGGLVACVLNRIGTLGPAPGKRSRGELPLLAPGLHMITAHDPDDVASPRVARHLPRFQAARPPKPDDWSTWPVLLANAAGPREAALHVPPQDGFGTVASSLAGIRRDGAVAWRFGVDPLDTVAVV